VWLGELPVAVLKSGARYYVAPDHQGAPHQITDAGVNVVWSWNHDPFGNGTPVGSFADDLRFPGQVYDSSAKLHFNNFRDYDPVTGRYIESDPIGLRGGINTYAYVGGNPLTGVDPRGLDRPVFNPGPWNDPNNVTNNNCTNYACFKDPKDHFTDPYDRSPDWTPPFWPWEDRDKSWCNYVKGGAKSNMGMVDQTSDPKNDGCPCKYHLVELWTTTNSGQTNGLDYHWYVLNSNGQWSSKHGGLPVGYPQNQYKNPRDDATSDYIAPYNYQFCGDLCTPD
jgi:RHS repeat-associated protein